MATLTDFMPHVLPYVAGCSSPLAEQMVRTMCHDFCMHAAIVQTQLDPIDAVANVAAYDIDTPNGTDVTLILSASFAGSQLECVKTGDCAAFNMGMGTGTPSAFMQAVGNSFTLNVAPAQTVSKAIAMLIATKPARNATTVADVLLNDYGPEIGMGVVGRLMLMPGHKFSAPRDAFIYTQAYIAARTEARIRADMSFGSGESRVRPRRFQ